MTPVPEIFASCISTEESYEHLLYSHVDSFSGVEVDLPPIVKCTVLLSPIP